MKNQSEFDSTDLSLEVARNLKYDGKISREEYWTIVQTKLKVLREIQLVLRRENLSLQISQSCLQLEIPLTSFETSVSMTLDVDDIRSVPFSVIADGPYEKFQGMILLKLARRSSEFIDIGANMGYYSLAAAKVNSTIKVRAFEPQPRVFSTLVNNISLNNLSDRVEAHNFGLGSKQSTMTMFIPKFTGSGGGSLANLHREEGEPIEVEVQVKVLDEYSVKWTNPDLIKIDVEGFEFEVISGGMNLIKKSRPTIIIELLRKWMKPFDKHPQDVIELLIEEGYVIYAIANDILNEIDKIDDLTIETNFICVHSMNVKHLEILSQYI
jgi:FkbM family methyltransferase